MTDQAFRLSDAQMAQFIAHGYVTITPDLPDEFHAEVFAKHEEVFEKEGNPGNNLLPRIPLVRQVLDHPSVVGALQSVCGDDYYLQPHRHPHHNKAHSKGQNMHQDGGKRWSHRTRYLLAFYYPQDTPLERGPSGIVPGSHYFNTPEGARIDGEVPLVTPAGTVTITNYDLWHRAMPNTSDQHRYMVKFLFARMSEPVLPAWNNRRAGWPGIDPALPGDGAELQKMYAHVWHWNLGDGSGALPTPEGSPAELLDTLAGEDERAGIAAAYDLAALGQDMVPGLIEKLGEESEMTRRNAAYALSAIGAPAVGALIDALGQTNTSTRTDAATTLGDIALAADAALPALVASCQDKHEDVRRAAAEALGTVGQYEPNVVPTLIDAVTDDHVGVRTAAVFALCRLGPQAAEAVEALEGVLDDENRYVRGDALHALQRIDTSQAKDALIKHLMPARWCPITSPESTF
ncbi:MAG: HEAT repeat domain-containing protein [Candidatus Latescibacterota bacterium]|nr:HEAT repeat domain-containing protein [Candidatus Latescibacterota bacterium]